MAVASLLALALSGSVWGAPEPLDLDQALLGLADHPRANASPELVARLPRRAALYLDCHRLAFGDSLAPDPERDRPSEIFLTPQAAQRIEVMERFFDVLLADLNHATESEAMAVAYIQFDRARIRQELGQISEPRVLELEVVYQDILHRRAASEIGQQLTRSLLAQALGRPEDPVRDLREPEPRPPPEPLPDLDTLYGAARASLGVRALIDGRGPADQALVGLELRQMIRELLLRLRLLESIGRSARTESSWRDIMLDESRTLYDQEAAADLGYSMSRQTRARMTEQRIAYCQALTWAELAALGEQSTASIKPNHPIKNEEP